MKPARTLVLCGPLSDPLDKKALDNAAFALRSIGFSVESPAEMEAPKFWRDAMGLLAAQVSKADVLVLLPRWFASQEARVLHQFAVGLGLRVWPLHLAMQQKPEEVTQ
jgi:hypothetical protein